MAACVPCPDIQEAVLPQTITTFTIRVLEEVFEEVLGGLATHIRRDVDHTIEMCVHLENKQQIASNGTIVGCVDD